MKVFFPIGSFYPSQSGGPNNTIYWITKALARQNVDVRVASTAQGLDPGKVPLNKWIKTDYGTVLYQRTMIHYLPVRLILRSLPVLKTADIIQLTSIFYPASFILAVFSVLLGKKVIWSPRGELDPAALIYSTRRKKPILWFIRHFLASRVTFHSTADSETQFIRDQMGEKVSIIQIPNYLEIPKKINAKTESYFLYLGRIHPKKAIDHLIRALTISKKFLPSQYTLKIAGDYDNVYGHSLFQLVEELDLSNRVQFLGHIVGEKKQQLLAGAYFSFMPSHTENFGNVVIEALAQGTPVIASRGTPWRILHERKAGFWIENSPGRIAEFIDKVIGLSKEEYTWYRTRALVLVQEEFDIQKNISKWLQAYLDHERN